jgi:hypothetical protein
MRSALVLVAVAIIAASCGGDDDVASTTVPASSGAIDITLEQSAEVPAEFPADVPLPADLLIEQADRLEGAASELFDVTGWYDGDAVTAARDYIVQVEAAGFTLTGRTDAPTNVFFTAANDDWFVSAGFYPDPVRQTGTSVGITVTPAESPAG